MFIPFLLTIINASKTHQIWYHSHVCSSETINIKQLTFQAENKLVNIPLSHFPLLPKCNFSFSPLKPSSGEAFSSCIGFSIGFLNFGSSHLVLVILQDLFKRLLRFCYKNSLEGILLVLWRRIWYSLKKSPVPLVNSRIWPKQSWYSWSVIKID